MSQIKIIPSFNIQIWCGLREYYTFNYHSIEEVENICQNYVDENPFCVTVTPTRYIYKNGQERGVIVGIIAYPRFPVDNSELIQHAMDLGNILMTKLKQHRVTITTPMESFMLENEEDDLQQLK